MQVNDFLSFNFYDNIDNFLTTLIICIAVFIMTTTWTTFRQLSVVFLRGGRIKIRPVVPVGVILSA